LRISLPSWFGSDPWPCPRCSWPWKMMLMIDVDDERSFRSVCAVVRVMSEYSCWILCEVQSFWRDKDWSSNYVQSTVMLYQE
jgi:hypothetical protein